MRRRKRKNTIIIGSLCAIISVMVVAYGVYGSFLKVDGTTSISSNFKVLITNIESKDKVGEASDDGDPKFENLSATFKTNLVSPGDSMTYEITVANQGNVNAALDKIDITKKVNKAINVTYDGITAGDKLDAGTEKKFTIKVEFDSSVTTQPKDTNITFDMKLEYVEEGQDNNKSTTTTDVLVFGGQSIQLVTSGEGLYADEYEPGRYVYKGKNPDNYITFNGENAGWRIIGIETDGTIKIMRASTIDKQIFDIAGARKTGYCSKQDELWIGCNVWAITPEYDNNSALSNGLKGAVEADSTLKTYLNGSYYEGLTSNKTAIQNHQFYYGPATWNNENLSDQIASEKKYSANSYVGIMQASDYIRSNADSASCGTLKLVITNSCTSTSYMSVSDSSQQYYTITPTYNSSANPRTNSSHMITVYNRGLYDNNGSLNSCGVLPTIYLKSDTELSGKGTGEDPFTITNYIE